MRMIIASLILALAGCTGASHAAPEEFRPLKQVTENSLRSGGYITTIGETAYVNDLDSWLERHPVNSVSYRAKLGHESVHSKRQIDAGLAAWLNQYLTDRAFMWEEEKRGWYVELLALRSGGLPINTNGVADVLAGYSNLSGKMVSREEALAWVNDVLAGRWKPAD
jgi:hypothetical protein